MANYYLGEIKMFGGNFAPVGFALCAGQLLPISQYTALFSILGTTFGGDGITTFGLPDLRGRAPLHWNQGPGLTSYVLGEMGGTESVTLLSTNLPQHNHAGVAASSADGTAGAPSSTTVMAGSASHDKIYSTNPATTSPPTVNTTFSGGNQPHENVQPFLAVNFIIALTGIFPSRN